MMLLALVPHYERVAFALWRDGQLLRRWGVTSSQDALATFLEDSRDEYDIHDIVVQSKARAVRTYQERESYTLIKHVLRNSKSAPVWRQSRTIHYLTPSDWRYGLLGLSGKRSFEDVAVAMRVGHPEHAETPDLVLHAIGLGATWMRLNGER